MKGKCSKGEGKKRFGLPCAGITLIRFTGVISAIQLKRDSTPRIDFTANVKKNFFSVTFIHCIRYITRPVNLLL
jgi:hypothetical protein